MKLYNVAINDVSGASKSPAYKLWANMVRRCYDDDNRKLFPTYQGCTVCPEWLSLSGFLAWVEKQGDITGLVLDKDLLQPGCKVYSPQTCLFIPMALNVALTLPSKPREWPLGVRPSGKGYRAEISGGIRNTSKPLGTRSTPLEAHRLWQQAKIASIVERLSDWTNPPLLALQAVDRIVAKLQQDIDADRQTFNL